MKEVAVDTDWFEPFHKGFRRTVQRKVYPYQKRIVVTYFAPSGEPLRKADQVEKYLEKHPHLGLALKHFTFHGKTIYKEPEETFSEVVVQTGKDKEVAEACDVQSPSKIKKTKTPEKKHEKEGTKQDRCEEMKSIPCLSDQDASPGKGRISNPDMGKVTKSPGGKAKSPGSTDFCVKVRSSTAGVRGRSPTAGAKGRSPGDGMVKIKSPKRRGSGSLEMKSSPGCRNVKEKGFGDATEVVKRPRGRPRKQTNELAIPQAGFSGQADKAPGSIPVQVESGAMLSTPCNDSSDDEVQLKLPKTKPFMTSVKPLKTKLKRPKLGVTLATTVGSSETVRKRGRPKKVQELEKEVAVKNEEDGAKITENVEKVSTEEDKEVIPSEKLERKDNVEENTCKADPMKKKVKHCPKKLTKTGEKCENGEGKGKAWKVTKKRVLGSKISSLPLASKTQKKERKQANLSKKRKIKTSSIGCLPDNQTEVNRSIKNETTELTPNFTSHFNHSLITKSLLNLTPPVELGTSFSDAMGPILSEIDYQSVEDCTCSGAGDVSSTQKDYSVGINFNTPEGPRVLTKFSQKNLSPSAGISCEEVETRYTSSEGAPSIFSPTCIVPHGKFTALDSASPEHKSTEILSTVDKGCKKGAKQYVSKVVLKGRKVVNVPAKVRGIKATVKLLERKCGLDLTPTVSLIKFDNVLLNSLSLGAYIDSGDSNSSKDVGESKISKLMKSSEIETQAIVHAEVTETGTLQEKKDSGVLDNSFGLFDKLLNLRKSCVTHDEVSSQLSENLSKIGKVTESLKRIETVQEKIRDSTVENSVNLHDKGPKKAHKNKEGSLGNTSQAVSTTAVHGEMPSVSQPSSSKTVDVVAKKKIEKPRKKRDSVDVDLNEENFEPDYEDSHSGNTAGSDNGDHDDEEMECTSEEDHVENLEEDVLQHHQLDKDYLMGKFLDGPLLSFQELGSPTLEREDEYRMNTKETGNAAENLNAVKLTEEQNPLKGGEGVSEVTAKVNQDENQTDLIKTPGKGEETLAGGCDQVTCDRESKLQKSESASNVDHNKETHILTSKTTAESTDEISQQTPKKTSDNSDTAGVSFKAPPDTPTKSYMASKAEETSSGSTPKVEGPKKGKKTIKIQKGDIDEDGYITRTTATGKKRFKVKSVVRKKTVTSSVADGDKVENLEDIIGQAIATSEKEEEELLMGEGTLSSTSQKASPLPDSTASKAAEIAVSLEPNATLENSTKEILRQSMSSFEKTDKLSETEKEKDTSVSSKAETDFDNVGKEVSTTEKPHILEAQKTSDSISLESAALEKDESSGRLSETATAKQDESPEAKIGITDSSKSDPVLDICKDNERPPVATIMEKQCNLDKTESKSGGCLTKSDSTVASDKLKTEIQGDVSKNETVSGKVTIAKPVETLAEENMKPKKADSERKTEAQSVSEVTDKNRTQKDAESDQLNESKTKEELNDKQIQKTEESGESGSCVQKTSEEKYITKLSDTGTQRKNDETLDLKNVVINEHPAKHGSDQRKDLAPGIQSKKYAEMDKSKTDCDAVAKETLQGTFEVKCNKNTKESKTKKRDNLNKIPGEKTSKSRGKEYPKGGDVKAEKIDSEVPTSSKIGARRRSSSQSTPTQLLQKNTKGKCEKETKEVADKSSKNKMLKSEESSKLKKSHATKQSSKESLESHGKKSHSKEKLNTKLHSKLKESDTVKPVKLHKDHAKHKLGEKEGNLHKEKKKRVTPEKSSELWDIEKDKDGKSSKPVPHVKESVMFFQAMEKEKIEPKKRTVRRSSKDEKSGKVETSKIEKGNVLLERQSSGEKIDEKRHKNCDETEDKETSKEKKPVGLTEKDTDISGKAAGIGERKRLSEQEGSITPVGGDGIKKRKLKVKGRQVPESGNTEKIKSEKSEAKETVSHEETTASVPVQNMSDPLPTKHKVRKGLLYCREDYNPKDLQPVTPTKKVPVKMGSLYCVSSSEEDNTLDTTFMGDELIGEEDAPVHIDFSALKGLKITMGSDRSVEVDKTKGGTVRRTVKFNELKVDEKTHAVVTKIAEEVKLDMSKYQQNTSSSIKLDHSLFASAMSSAISVDKPSQPVAPGQRTESLVRDDKDEVRSPKVATVQPVKDSSNASMSSYQSSFDQRRQSMVKQSEQVGGQSGLIGVGVNRTLSQESGTQKPDIKAQGNTQPDVQHANLGSVVVGAKTQDNHSFTEQSEPAISSSRPVATVTSSTAPVSTTSVQASDVSAVVSVQSGGAAISTSVLTSTATTVAASTNVSMSQKLQEGGAEQRVHRLATSSSPIRIKRPSRSSSAEPTPAKTPELVKDPPPVHRVVSCFPSPLDSSTPSHATPSSCSQQEVTTTVFTKSVMANKMKVKPGVKGHAPVRTIQMQGKDGTMKTYKVNKVKVLGKKDQPVRELSNLNLGSKDTAIKTSASANSEVTAQLSTDSQTNNPTIPVTVASTSMQSVSKDSLEPGEIYSYDSEAFVMKSTDKSNDVSFDEALIGNKTKDGSFVQDLGSASSSRQKEQGSGVDAKVKEKAMDKEKGMYNEGGNLPQKVAQKRKSNDMEGLTETKRRTVNERLDKDMDQSEAWNCISQSEASKHGSQSDAPRHMSQSDAVRNINQSHAVRDTNKSEALRDVSHSDVSSYKNRPEDSKKTATRWEQEETKLKYPVKDEEKAGEGALIEEEKKQGEWSRVGNERDRRSSTDIPSRLPKLEKSSTGWYTGVIDDDDLAEIHGSERTVKNDLEETFVNSLETCLQDEDFNRLGCIFVEFVKHRLMASPTHKRKFEEAFFRRVDLVSGRFVTFLGGVEQALEVSGETRPLSDVPVVRTQISSLALTIVTRTLHECQWSHTYKILYALERRHADDVNKATEKFMSDTERACLALACHMETNMLDKALDLLESADVDWLSIQKMPNAGTVKVRKSRIVMLYSLLRKLLDSLENRTFRHPNSSMDEEVTRKKEKYMAGAIKLLQNILQTYEDDVNILKKENYNSLINVNLLYNRMLQLTTRLAQTNRLFQLYHMQFSLPYVHAHRYQQRKILFYLEKNTPTQEVMSEAVKMARHGVLCQLYPEQEQVKPTGAQLLLWPDLTRFEMYLLLINHLYDMCNTFARLAREGHQITDRSCSLTVVIENRKPVDSDLENIFKEPANMRRELFSARLRFSRMMLSIFQPPTEVQKLSENCVLINHEKLLVPLRSIWYSHLKKEGPPPWENESLKSQMGDNTGSAHLESFVQRLVGNLWPNTGSMASTGTSESGSSPRTLLETPPRSESAELKSSATGTEIMHGSKNVSNTVGVTNYPQEVDRRSQYSANEALSRQSVSDASGYVNYPMSSQGYSNKQNSDGQMSGQQFCDQNTHAVGSTNKNIPSLYKLDNLGQGHATNRPFETVTKFIKQEPQESLGLREGSFSQNAQIHGTLPKDTRPSSHPPPNTLHPEQSSYKPSHQWNASIDRRPHKFHQTRGRWPYTKKLNPRSGYKRGGHTRPTGCTGQWSLAQDSLLAENQGSPDSFPGQQGADRDSNPIDKRATDSSADSERVDEHVTKSQPLLKLPLDVVRPSSAGSSGWGRGGGSSRGRGRGQYRFTEEKIQEQKRSQKRPPYKHQTSKESRTSSRYPQMQHLSAQFTHSPQDFPRGHHHQPNPPQPSNQMDSPRTRGCKMLNSIRESVCQTLASKMHTENLQNANITELEENLTQEFFHRFVKSELDRNPSMTFNDELFDRLTIFLAERLQ